MVNFSLCIAKSWKQSDIENPWFYRVSEQFVLNTSSVLCDWSASRKHYRDSFQTIRHWCPWSMSERHASSVMTHYFGPCVHVNGPTEGGELRTAYARPGVITYASAFARWWLVRDRASWGETERGGVSQRRSCCHARDVLRDYHIAKPHVGRVVADEESDTRHISEGRTIQCLSFRVIDKSKKGWVH